MSVMFGNLTWAYGKVFLGKVYIVYLDFKLIFSVVVKFQKSLFKVKEWFFKASTSLSRPENPINDKRASDQKRRSSGLVG